MVGRSDLHRRPTATDRDNRRIVASMMFIAGVALVGIFTAAVATYFISSDDEEPKVEDLIEAEPSAWPTIWQQ